MLKNLKTIKTFITLLLQLMVFATFAQSNGTIDIPKNDDGSVIDLMVLYTSDVARIKGGETKMKEWIDNNMMVALNAAMATSGVNTRIYCVAKKQTPFPSGGSNSTDLRKIGGSAYYNIKADPTVAQWREEAHADAVIWLIAERRGGQATTFKSLKGGQINERWMVSDLSISTIVHEFGHVMGGQHEVDDSEEMPPGSGKANPNYGQPEEGPFPYSHGYSGSNYCAGSTVGGFMWDATRDVINKYHPNYRKDVPGYGKLELLYSTPRRSFRGCPMGTTNFSDNARTFNETAPYVAKVKSSEVKWTGATSTDWHNSQNWNPKRVPRAIDDVVIPGGLKDYPKVIRSAYTRNLFIQKGGLMEFNSGNLSVGGHLIVDGTLTAKSGTTVTMKSTSDKGATLRLSSSSKLGNLTIGNPKGRTWVQLRSRLLVGGNLTLEALSVLDPKGQPIAVDGEWNDETGWAFNYGYGNVKLGASKPNVNTVSYVTPIEKMAGSSPQSSGTYTNINSGWWTVAEKGNLQADFGFGGKAGDLYLSGAPFNSTTISRGPFAGKSMDKAEYVNKIDAWALYTYPLPFNKGVTYTVEYDVSVEGESEGLNTSLNYGDGALPSLMKAAGKAEALNWQPKQYGATDFKVKRDLRVNSTGTYDLAVRVNSNSEKSFGFTLNSSPLKITPNVKIKDNFGKADVDTSVDPHNETKGEETTDTGTTPPSTSTGGMAFKKEWDCGDKKIGLTADNKLYFVSRGGNSLQLEGASAVRCNGDKISAYVKGKGVRMIYNPETFKWEEKEK